MGNAIGNAMKTIVSIDRAGRLVLPKAVRDLFHLHPGTQLEIKTGRNHLELKPVGIVPSLAREGGVLVHQGVVRVPLHPSIQQMREERIGILSRTAGH